MVLSDDWWRNDVSWHALEEGYEAEKKKWMVVSYEILRGKLGGPYP
jgi:hypothetical protein